MFIDILQTRYTQVYANREKEHMVHNTRGGIKPEGQLHAHLGKCGPVTIYKAARASLVTWES